MNSNTEFNQNLIEIILKAIPSKADQINMLMSVTSMSKEAAYRRLRGDVPFSFAEACLIATKLQISLDDIAKSGKKGKLLFELRIDPDELLTYNYQKLHEHEDSLSILIDSAHSIMTAWNVIPYSIFFPYENLSKMYMFKWYYQIRHKTSPIKFSDIIIPDDIKKRIKDLGNKTFVKAECTYIFDRGIFSSFINELKHFHLLGLISDDDLHILKTEFHELLDHIEDIAIHGRNKKGNIIWVYLSNIDFDHNYTYVEGDNFTGAYMDNIYLMNTIISRSPNICNMHKEWIESLRRYSTLISISGEKERRLFFGEQRKLLDESL